MNRLKNILQYDASNYIHIAILILLYYVSRTSYLGYVLLIPEIVFVFKKSKTILIYTFFILIIILLRFDMIDSQQKDTTFPVRGIIQEVHENNFVLKSDKTILCYYDEANDLVPGMVVTVYGNSSKISGYNIPHVFDYDMYLKSKGIMEVASIQSLELEGRKFNINIIKLKIINYIDRTFNIKTASYLKLFVLGEKDNYNISSERTSKLGISHIFAISGMHIGLIAGFILYLLGKTNISIESNQNIVIIFLIIYNIITGFKISIIRATLLISGIFLKDRFNILLTSSDLISFSFLLMLIINPYGFYSIGFQLSYLISIAIILGQYLFHGDAINILIKITIFATMISLPITLEINQSLGLIFILSNLFFVLFVTYIMLPMSFIVVIISPVSRIYEIVINLFELSLHTFERYNIILNLNITTGLYKMIFWIILFLIFICLKQFKRVIILVFTLILLVSLSLNFSYMSTRFVRFLDVSQGDAIHIHDGKCDMLIDTGNNDNYDQLIRYFKANNTYSLDFLIVTHHHMDHYGELEDLIEQLDVNIIYVNKELLGSNNEVIATKGDCFSCGESRFQVLHANMDDSNENNNSIVLYAVIGNLRYLFTGDIETDAEIKILQSYDIEIDVLKVAHHGSKTSSNSKLLKELNGELAIISVDKENQYGFPDETILKELRLYRYSIFRTDESGTITIYDMPVIESSLIELYLKQKRRRYIIRNISI